LQCIDAKLAEIVTYSHELLETTNELVANTNKDTSVHKTSNITLEHGKLCISLLEV